MTTKVQLVDDPDVVQVLGNPVRLQVLEALHPPASAATVARAIGQSRQNANYHLKELERVGLVVRAGERRVGNFIETLYEASARTLLISPRLTLGGGRRAAALATQVSLENLVTLGERLARDAVVLLDSAAFDGATIASASVEAEVSFKGAAEREGFLREYLAAVAALAKKYGARGGERFRVAFAAYPEPDESGGVA
jgi:DNA-binding transcriptional ArsR family regulator